MREPTGRRPGAGVGRAGCGSGWVGWSRVWERTARGPGAGVGRAGCGGEQVGRGRMREWAGIHRKEQGAGARGWGGAG